MNSGIKNLIQQKVGQSLRANNAAKLAEISTALKFTSDNTRFAFSLPLKTEDYDVTQEAEDILKNSRDVFPKIQLNAKDSAIAFVLPRNMLIKNILENNYENLSQPCFLPKKEKVVVEFSSPNVAKRFHVGHLRSTIIGNYVSNLHTYLGNDVTKLNYLGDWGTQLGYIELGVEMLNISEESINSNPLCELTRAYVTANTHAKKDSDIVARAREIFERLEKGDEAVSGRWETLRKYTMEELKKTYERLDVNFDEYHWESMYSFKQISPIIEELERLNLLKVDEEKRKVIVLDDEKSVPLIKSDGSTLYLTRDVAAAIDRHEKYNFDRMYYVTDKTQGDHFSNLTKILEKMEQPAAKKIQHIKFGKIGKMSTRLGNVVFLSDYLNEARDQMRKRQSMCATTKISSDLDDNSAEILGISAIIMHDLRQKRERDYNFDWDFALNIKGETGVRLQYTHCRLVNLEKNCGASLPRECDPSLLTEPIVDALLERIMQFDATITKSYLTLEPSCLAKFLFELCHTVNKAFNELRVKGAPNDVSSQRLLLFRVSRNVIARGMQLLGLRPLEKM